MGTELEVDSRQEHAGMTLSIFSTLNVERRTLNCLSYPLAANIPPHPNLLPPGEKGPAVLHTISFCLKYVIPMSPD